MSDPRLPSTRRQRGLSLVECAIALAITSLALGTALPGLNQMLQQRRLEGVAAQLETDVHLARGLSVMRNQNLRLSFLSDPAGACYVVHTGAADACTCGGEHGATCRPGDVALRSVRLPASGTVAMRANVRSMVLDASRGTVTPTASVRLTSADGRELRVIVNVMGRVRACSPSALRGYAAC